MVSDKKPNPPRRDIVVTAAGAFVLVGGVLAMWPLISALGPGAGTPEPETTDVDIAAVEPGRFIAAAWRDKPVLLRRRTTLEIERSRAVPIAALRDRIARNAALPPESPALDLNRVTKERPEWLVVMGTCPHDACVLRVADINSGLEREIEEAFRCPCDGSRFDVAGRVRGGPAPTNLPVPPYRFLTPSRIRIG